MKNIPKTQLKIENDPLACKILNDAIACVRKNGESFDISKFVSKYNIPDTERREAFTELLLYTIGLEDLFGEFRLLNCSTTDLELKNGIIVQKDPSGSGFE